MPGPRLRLSALVCAASLGLTACSSGGSGDGGSGSQKRSADTFCSVLREGNETMKSNANGAAEGLGSQLVAIGLNVGAFTILVHKLDAVAPAEISSEMSGARTAWDDNNKAIAGAVTDPLGALTSAAMVSLVSAQSIKAVDEYALGECGMTPFGSVRKDEPTGPGWQCSQFGEKGPFVEVDSYQSLVDELDSIATSEDQGISLSAHLLREAISSFEPAPRFADEALGRLGFVGAASAEQLIRKFDEALQSGCGTDSSTDRITSYFQGLTPRPETDPEGVRVSDPYVTNCGDLEAWTLTRVIYICDAEGHRAGLVASIDLETGIASWFEIGTGEHAAGGVSFSDVSFDVTEASGLEPASWDATLRVNSAITGEESFSAILEKGTGETPDIRGYNVEIWPGHVYASTPRSGGTMFDETGKKLWSRKAGGGTRFTANTVVADGNLVHADTGKVLAMDLSSYDVRDGNDCGTARGAAGSDGSDVFAFDRGPSSIDAFTGDSSTIFSGDPVGDVIIDAYRTRAVDPRGKVRWTLDGEAVDQLQIVGNWVVATNTADEKVLVDPRTGTDVTSSRSDVAERIFAMGDRVEVLFVGDSEVLVRGSGVSALDDDSDSGDDVVVRMPRSLIC